MRRVIALALLVTVGTLTACGSGSAVGQPKGAAATRETAASPSGRPTARSTPVWIDDLQMVSAVDGWALVWSANPAGEAALEPARTSDAGRSWTVVTPPLARPLLDNGEALLYAASARRAWIAVNHGDGKSTVVFGTSDGGQSWTESNPVVGYQAVAMDFAGADRGWLLESQGAAMGQDPVQVYGTADGGATWSLLAGGLPAECGKTGMAFSPAQVGWITSDCVLGYQVLVSRDGGAQWAAEQLPLPNSACADGCTAFQAQFAGPGTMLEVGSYPGAAVLLLSPDSGQTWRTEAMPAGAGPYPRITFFGTDDAIAVSAGSQGVIGQDFYLTSDGGLTWTAVSQGRQFGSSGAQFDFVSPQAGFAWIADGTGLYETADAGRTWTAVVAQLG
jgi:photosystem II stability/assembly factor-like uncharacterized protein